MYKNIFDKCYNDFCTRWVIYEIAYIDESFDLLLQMGKSGLSLDDCLVLFKPFLNKKVVEYRDEFYSLFDYDCLYKFVEYLLEEYNLWGSKKDGLLKNGVKKEDVEELKTTFVSCFIMYMLNQILRKHFQNGYYLLFQKNNFNLEDKIKELNLYPDILICDFGGSVMEIDSYTYPLYLYLLLFFERVSFINALNLYREFIYKKDFSISDRYRSEVKNLENLVYSINDLFYNDTSFYHGSLSEKYDGYRLKKGIDTLDSYFRRNSMRVFRIMEGLCIQMHNVRNYNRRIQDGGPIYTPYRYFKELLIDFFEKERICNEKLREVSDLEMNGKHIKSMLLRFKYMKQGYYSDYKNFSKLRWL